MAKKSLCFTQQLFYDHVLMLVFFLFLFAVLPRLVVIIVESFDSSIDNSIILQIMTLNNSMTGKMHQYSIETIAEREVRHDLRYRND